MDQVEVLDDGTVLASWWLVGRGDGQRKVGRLGQRWVDAIGLLGRVHCDLQFGASLLPPK